MDIQSFKKMKMNVLGLSILLHALFFLSVSYEVHLAPISKKEESYYYYEPAYLYHDKVTSKAHQVAQAPDSEKKEDLQPIKLPDVDSQNILNKENFFKALAKQLEKTNMGEDLSNTMQSEAGRYTQPLHMIGDKLLDDPLRQLLGRAITSHLYYPDVAKELFLRGTVTIGFLLHPDGRITDIKLLKTSKEKMLDLAALSAVKEASPIYNVDLYLKESKYLVINILF